MKIELFDRLKRIKNNSTSKKIFKNFKKRKFFFDIDNSSNENEKFITSKLLRIYLTYKSK